jgi:clathrin heavy chain
LQVHAEELPALLSLYERNGYFEEIISLMEGGLGLERAHMVSYAGLISRHEAKLPGDVHGTVRAIRQVPSRKA